MKRLFWLTLLPLFGSLGCTEPRTEVIVVVNKYGITIGKDVDGLQLIVKNGTGLDPIYESDKHPLCPDNAAPMPGCWTLPVTATLVPGPSNPNDKVYVQVLGLRGGAQVIGDEASFEFLKHVSQRLDFVLYGNCLDVDCTSVDQACNYNGECAPISPTSFNGDPQLDGLPPGVIPDLGSGSGDLAGADLYGIDLAGLDLNMSMMNDLMSLDLRGIDFAGVPPIDMANPNDMSLLDGPANVSPWVPQTSNTSHRLRAVWGWDPNHVVAVGDAGTVVYTTTGGSTWLVAPSPSTTADLYSVWGTMNGIEIFAVGDGGAIIKSMDGGASWTVSVNPWLTTIDLRGVWGDTGGANFWVVGKGLLLGQWNGIAWTTVCGGISNDSMNVYNGVWSTGASLNLWVGGLTGGNGIIATEDLTVSCPGPSVSPSGSPMFDLSCTTQCPAPIIAPTTSVLGLGGDISAAQATATTAAGNIYRCSTSLCMLEATTGSALNGVWSQSAPTGGFAVGAAGAIENRISGTWMGELSPTVSNLNGVWGMDGGSGPIWAVGDSGKIFKR
jgi:hypothetical protein